MKGSILFQFPCKSVSGCKHVNEERMEVDNTVVIPRATLYCFFFVKHCCAALCIDLHALIVLSFTWMDVSLDKSVC